MGGRGLARFKLKTWQCDELSARRSMNFLADDPANCSAGEGIFARVTGSGSSLPRKVAWPGHITRTAATCLSASPCRQNRRCAVPKVRPALSKQLICPTGRPPPHRLLTLSLGASAGTK